MQNFTIFIVTTRHHVVNSEFSCVIFLGTANLDNNLLSCKLYILFETLLLFSLINQRNAPIDFLNGFSIPLDCRISTTKNSTHVGLTLAHIFLMSNLFITTTTPVILILLSGKRQSKFSPILQL